MEKIISLMQNCRRYIHVVSDRRIRVVLTRGCFYAYTVRVHSDMDILRKKKLINYNNELLVKEISRVGVRLHEKI